MNRRAFFLGALGFAFAACIAHCVARGFLEEAMHRKAARISQAAKEHATYIADPLAVQASHMRNLLTGTGVVLTVLSVICIPSVFLLGAPGPPCPTANAERSRCRQQQPPRADWKAAPSARFWDRLLNSFVHWPISFPQKSC